MSNVAFSSIFFIALKKQLDRAFNTSLKIIIEVFNYLES